MTQRQLILALVAVSLTAACKNSNSFGVSQGKPSFTYAQPGLSCADPIQDPDGGQGSNLVVCTLDFGGVPIGQTVTANISINNDAATSYNIVDQSQPTDPQFVVQKLQLPVTVTQSVPMAISFKPFSESQLNDSFYLTTDAQSVGKVVFNLTGSGINIAVSLKPTNIDFGKVIIHSTQTESMVVTNLSTGPITLSPLVPQGISASLFSVAFGQAATDFTQTYTYATPIPPNAQVTFLLSFAPKQQSYADENAYITLSYAADHYVNVGLKGFGVKTGLSVTTNPPSSNLTPSISFGHIPLNNSVTDFVYVQNISNQVIKLYHSYLDKSDGQVFTVAQPGGSGCPAPMNCQQIMPGSGTYTLNPGDKLTYPITFAPLQGQGYLGDFAVQDDHGDNVTVPISGGGGGPAISCQTIPPSALQPCTSNPANSCIQMQFGEVAVDIGAVLQLLCTNTGNDITLNGKIDPSAELQVSQGGLLISQTGSSYSAQLFQSGLSTSLVALRSNEQFVVQVTYNPTVATPSGQVETATLHILSNAVLTPSTEVDLTGSGLVLTDCNLSISPISLNFEQVTTGQTVQLPITLVNSGNNPCLINGLVLSPDTDSAFTISSVTAADAGTFGAGNSPPPSIKLCGVNEPASDNCTSPYGTEYQVLVQFSPTTTGTFQGLLDFIVSSKSAPSQDVTLSGTAGTGCLIISPQELDFGNVGIKSGDTYCKTNSRHFRALNTCSTPLVVTGLTNSVQSGNDFRISSSPQLPFNLQVGLTFDFEEQFEPQSAGAKYGSANVVAQPSGGVANTYLAAFHGNASNTRQQVDTYDIPAAKVDILWIIGYANIYDIAYVLGLSPYDSTPGLAQSLGNFVQPLAGVDYHMAVISSVDCNSQFNAFDQPTDFLNPGLQMLPCSGCTAPGNGPTIITSADSNPDTELYNIMNNMVTTYNTTPIYWYEGDCSYKQYPVLGGDGFEPAYQALNGAITSGYNKNFLRSDAALVVNVVNNSDDTSANLTGHPLNFYYTFFQNLKGYNPLTPFIFNAVSITPAEFASGAYHCPNNQNIYFDTCPTCGGSWNDTQIPTMVQQTGGQLIDLCTTDWGPAMTSLGQTSSALLTSFALSGSPVNPPAGITVDISGTQIPEYTVDGGAPVWVYDPLTGTLTFPNASNAPGAGDTLTITYDNICY